MSDVWHAGPMHPRPQLVREHWEDLSGPWGFAVDDADEGVQRRWYLSPAPFDREIVVPFPPESPMSGIHDRGFHPVVWYRRAFVSSDVAAGERLLLHFGAVDYRATVWVDGRHVGDHEGGHTPFSLDITTDLADGDEHVVVVRAEDQPRDVTQPRGKQDWQPEPHAFWYHRTTGIWQPVWLERVPEMHLTELQWTPDLPRASVVTEMRFSRMPDRPLRARVRLRLGEEVLADQVFAVTDQVLHQTISVAAARNSQDLGRLTWSPQSPVLLDAEVTLLDDGGSVVDRVDSYLGFRSVGFADGKFLLNGRPLFLRMVLEQGYWPESHLAAPGADALRREVELIKELGFNGARVHQKVEDPRFLSWCDRLGLLVWAEMPSAYSFSAAAVERLTREWLDVVRRDRSHPCVVTWVPFNESWGIHDLGEVAGQRHYVSAVYHLTKALDPSRPVIGNDGWEHTDGDIWGVHDYGGSGAGFRERYGDAGALERSLREGRPYRRRVVLGDAPRDGRPVVITEFGGLSYTPTVGQKWAGYSTVESAEELLERFADLVTALLDSPEVAGFCYTQLTDVEQEKNGLLTDDRRPKVAPAQVRAVMRRPSAAVPAEEVDLYRAAAAEAARASLVGVPERPELACPDADARELALVGRLRPGARR